MNSAISQVAMTPPTQGREEAVKRAVDEMRRWTPSLEAPLVVVQAEIPRVADAILAAAYPQQTEGKEDRPVVRGEEWERDFRGVLDAVTEKDAEDYADRIARLRAPTLTADEAAKEYASALAKEFGLARQSESAPSGDPVDGNDAGLPDRDQSGRRGASQPANEVHAMCSLDTELVDRLSNRLIAAEQRAEIARGNTQREYDRAAQLVHQVKVAEADRDRLQRENEQLKTLMRYGSEKCHDALRGLVRAVDRFGWLTGRSMESRDTLLAKARDALGEGPGRKQSY